MYLAWNDHFACKVRTLLPGDVHITRAHEVLCTVLGSCVAVCLSDMEQGIWGMNHFLLPEGRSNAGAVEDPAWVPPRVGLSELRYGTQSMEALLSGILRQGGERRRLHAKVFGGASMVRGFGREAVGAQNSAFARAWLTRAGIPIKVEDVGGQRGRKLFFITSENRVLRKALEPAAVALLSKTEARCRANLAPPLPPSGVALAS